MSGNKIKAMMFQIRSLGMGKWRLELEVMFKAKVNERKKKTKMKESYPRWASSSDLLYNISVHLATLYCTLKSLASGGTHVKCPYHNK